MICQAMPQQEVQCVWDLLSCQLISTGFQSQGRATPGRSCAIGEAALDSSQGAVSLLGVPLQH